MSQVGEGGGRRGCEGGDQSSGDPCRCRKHDSIGREPGIAGDDDPSGTVALDGDHGLPETDSRAQLLHECVDDAPVAALDPVEDGTAGGGLAGGDLGPEGVAQRASGAGGRKELGGAGFD